MGEGKKVLKAAGGDVFLFLGDTPPPPRRYAESLHTPFPVLADPDRDVYRHFGLEKALLVVQRTASVVVDRQGVIRYIKRATNPMTWLQESRELLAFVEGMKSERDAR